MLLEKVYELFKKYKWQEVTLDDSNLFFVKMHIDCQPESLNDFSLLSKLVQNNVVRGDSSIDFKKMSLDVFTEGELRNDQKYKIFMLRTNFSKQFDDIKIGDTMPPNTRVSWINPIIILGLTDDEENIDSSFNYWISELTDEERELIEEFRSEYFKLLPNLIY